MRPTFAFALVAVLPVALLASACSGTSIRPSTDTGSTDPGAEGGAASTHDGGPLATSDDGGGGPVLPETCPCPAGSYCDLSTNSCKLGCTDTSQCVPGDSCDTSTRTCQKPKPGLPSCPIPAAVSSDGGAAACNGVTPLGKDVAQTCKTGAIPAAHGGTVRDGVYVLTATDFYSASCQAGTFASTIYVCGGTWAINQGSSTASSASSTATATFSAATLTLATSCGGTSPSAATPYDATDSSITIYTTTGATDGYADHYTRQ